MTDEASLCESDEKSEDVSASDSDEVSEDVSASESDEASEKDLAEIEEMKAVYEHSISRIDD